MGEPTRKPDIRELVGVAVNTSALTLKAGHELALDRVAAVGAAALAVQLGADREDVPICAARPLVYGVALDPRDVLASELIPMLWHIRYGAQFDLVPKAVALFAEWIAYRPAFAEHQDVGLRRSFAVRVMHEWLSDRCTACAGSKRQQRSRSGAWIRPLGSMQRNATFRPCTACCGSGRAPVRHPERMKTLGLTRAEYDAQHWAQRFTAALGWLNQMLPSRLVRVLTAELERRKRRVLARARA